MILTRQKRSQHNAYEYIHACEEQWINTWLRRTGFTLFVTDSPGTIAKKLTENKINLSYLNQFTSQLDSE